MLPVIKKIFSGPALPDAATDGLDLSPSKLASDIAANYFDKGYNCAQSVLMSASEIFGVEIPPELVRGAASFTGGIGYSGCVCGALVGASIFTGIISADEKRPRKNKKTLDINEKLQSIFRDNFKTTCCRVLRRDRDFKDRKANQRCREITAKTSGFLAALLCDYSYELYQPKDERRTKCREE